MTGLDSASPEAQQALARLVIAVLGLGFLLGLIAAGKAADPFMLLSLWVVYAVFAYLLLIVAAAASVDSPIRRFISLLADMAIISALLHYAPPLMAPLYIVYLAVELDYGFRYGEHYLLVAMAVAVFSFIGVIATTPFWAEGTPFSIGLLLGLIGLPLYISTQLARIGGAKSKIEHANQLKTEFMANMSHGLRTPVNTIVGLSHILQRLGLVGEGGRYIAMLRIAAKELEKEADQSLSWFRLEAGGVALFNESFDLYKIVIECVQLLRPQADAKQLPLRLGIDPRVPYWVEGDSYKLGQILTNLLGNAIKFTQDGFIEASVTLLEQDGDTATLCITVKDTGIGIPDARKRSILEPYCQAEATTERHYGGSGLGTAIARKTVEAIGGELWFQSVQGKGTVFWARLAFKILPEPDDHPLIGKLAVLAIIDDARQSSWMPLLRRRIGRLDHCRADTLSEQVLTDYDLVFLAPSVPLDAVLPFLKRYGDRTLPPTYVRLTDEDEASVRHRGGLITVDPWNERGLYHVLHARALWKQVNVNHREQPIIPAARAARILVAEDHETHQLITRVLLEQAGYHVTVVGNGLDALAALRAATYDLAIFDAQMPGMDGLEALRRYRAEARDASIPIIITSADIALESAQRFEQAGAAHYLTKPLKREMLLWIISHTLDQTTPTAGAQPKLIQAPSIPSGGPAQTSSILDSSYLQELKDHNPPELLGALIASVQRTSRRAVTDLEQAMARQDQEGYWQALHAMANAAAAVGAETVCQLCHDAKMTQGRPLSPDDGWLKKIKRAQHDLSVALEHDLNQG